MRYAITIYTFLIRLYNYEDERLQQAESVLMDSMNGTLEDLHKMFYKHFEDGFCALPREKITINVHTFMHLLASRRRNGPLWQTSAEDIEGLFAVLRRCFHSGTRNIPKQILQNFYLRDL